MRRNDWIELVVLLLIVNVEARAEPDGHDTAGDPLPKGAVMRLGTRRFRHEGAVYAVAYSPDGSVLASCSEDKSIRLWDPGSGREVCRFVGHTSAVYSLAFTGDGKRIVSVGGDNTMRIWDVATGAETAKQEVAIQRLGAVAISRDGTLIAAAGEGRTLVLWRMDGVDVLEIRRAPAGWVRSLAFSPDGSILAVAGEPGEVRLVAVADGHVIRTLAGNKQWSSKVVFSADGKLIATSGRDASVRVWDVGTGKEVRSVDGCEFVANGVCFSPDGTRLAASGRGGDVFVWETATGKEVFHFTGDSESVNDLAFSPDGRTLAAGSYDLRLFDLETGKPQFAFDGHREDVCALAFSPDGATLASGGGHSVAYLWSVKTGAVRQRLPYRNVRVADLAYSPDGKRLAAAIDLFELRVWEVDTGQVVVDRAKREPQGMTSHVSFSGDGKLLAWSGCNVISLLDGLTGADVRELSGADGPRALAFRGRPERLCVATENSLLSFGLDSEHAREVPGNDSPPLQYTTWSEDGRVAASALQLLGGVQIRNMHTGQALRTIEDDGIYYRLQLTGDGNFLAGVGVRRKASRVEHPDGTISNNVSLDEGLIRIWSVVTGKQVAEISGHAGPVKSVAISPDGKLLATGGADTTVLLWDLAELRRR